jgi:23S rRNA (uracil1939-C5)-methyltransferase
MLALRAPKRLTYLSCHPASLARDLKILSDVFEVESLTFFDLFPQTGHIETLVQLVTRAAR